MHQFFPDKVRTTLIFYEGQNMRKQEVVVPVVFALHDSTGKYWLNTAVAICSVAMHSSVPVQFFVMHDDTLTNQAKHRLTEICRKFNCTLNLMKVKVPDRINVDNFGKFSVASIFRLLIPQAFKSFNQVVYLDSDLVFNGLDIATLILSGAKSDKPLAGVVDPYIAIPKSQQIELTNLGLDPAAYINSGVLVIRPSSMPENLLEEFEKFQKIYGSTIHPDQDFLNVVCKGKINHLIDSFNFQACLMNNSLFKDLDHYQKKIVHYAGSLKPLDGTFAPGFLPFWMHAALIPEIALHIKQKNEFRYAFPAIEDPHSMVRKILKPQPKVLKVAN